MADGFYYAGAVSVETWVAEKNEQAKLPDEFSQTHLKNSDEGNSGIQLSRFEWPSGISQGSIIQNKVVIIQILGPGAPIVWMRPVS